MVSFATQFFEIDELQFIFLIPPSFLVCFIMSEQLPKLMSQRFICMFSFKSFII
jgi:hypothetical protein